MRKNIFVIGMLVLAAVLLLRTAPAIADVYDLELACLVDVSGSIDASEYALQKTGYVNAFKVTVAGLFGSSTIPKPFYALYGEWSGASQQSVQVTWTLIDSAAAAIAFGDAIAGTTRAYSGNTAVQSALAWGGGLFSNGIDSLRQVIDISGDGERNEGLTGTVGRDSALTAGVDAINGLVIDTTVGGSLYNYYRDYVISGGLGVPIVASSFADFEGALARKITYETTGGGAVPIPGGLLLLGSGLFGLAGYGYQRRQKV